MSKIDINNFMDQVAIGMKVPREYLEPSDLDEKKKFLESLQNLLDKNLVLGKEMEKEKENVVPADD